jgi:hypothetical protein
MSPFFMVNYMYGWLCWNVIDCQTSSCTTYVCMDLDVSIINMWWLDLKTQKFECPKVCKSLVAFPNIYCFDINGVYSW